MAATPHDPHARPPDNLRQTSKRLQKSAPDTSNSGHDVLDTASLSTDYRVREQEMPDSHVHRCRKAFELFMNRETPEDFQPQLRCFEVKSLPGLFLYPSLFPVEIQIRLMNKLLHRDLGNPNHKTNLHLHYDVPEPSSEDASCLSWFELDQHSTIQPLDETVHRPISLKQALEKKLRWVTLGGQYDWTQKTYPDGKPPEFPEDIANLFRGAFSSVDPQAAILNFYSPGDTLSLHRDVSEYCDRALISLSIGCDALFLVANTDGTESATIQLRSGDVVVMAGDSRYAWHAVPKILPGTCPELLKSWPAVATDSTYEPWRGWLANKRINLNVRQMRDEPYVYQSDSADPTTRRGFVQATEMIST